MTQEQMIAKAERLEAAAVNSAKMSQDQTITPSARAIWAENAEIQIIEARKLRRKAA